MLAAASQIDTGDTAWMMCATALVLLMTPALGLFYAGLVRSKNTLNTFMMSIAALAVVTIAWAAVGYSLAFDEGKLVGGFDHLFLQGVDFEPREGQTIPHLLFMAYQATFCILTTALVSGAVVERMRFGTYLVFMVLWSLLVYCVMAHWVFGGGWLAENGTLDFAGGVPVEMGSGFSALAAAMVVGARKDFGRQALLPHNSVYVLLGAGLLWFGWFGFNGGSGIGTEQQQHPGVRQHDADAGVHAVRLVHAGLHAQPPGHGGRRGHRDHRRLRGHHPGRAATSARAGRWRWARSPRSRATCSSCGARGRASMRRSTCSPPTASPASRASCSSGSSRRSRGTASRTAWSTATAICSSTRSWPRRSRRSTRRWPRSSS